MTKDKEKAKHWKQPERNDTLNTEKQKFNQILASYQKKTENQRELTCAEDGPETDMGVRIKENTII